MVGRSGKLRDEKRRQIFSCRTPAAFKNDGTFKRARKNQKNEGSRTTPSGNETVNAP
jgi:hypothetical protein